MNVLVAFSLMENTLFAGSSSFVIGLKPTNSDSFVLNSSCDWQKNVRWPRLSSLHCNIIVYLVGHWCSNPEVPGAKPPP